MDPEIDKLRQELERAKEALRAMYALKGGMEKPIEHAPTRRALRLTEQVLYGYASTSNEGAPLRVD